MRLFPAAALVLASGAVACSLLLDDEGLTGSEPTSDGGSGDSSTSGSDGGADAMPLPGAEIGNGTGRLGALVIDGDSVINAYAALKNEVPPAGPLEVSAVSGWAEGDVVLVWRTTGAAAAPSGATTTVDLGSSGVGKYELARIKAIESSGTTSTITLDRTLANAYPTGSAQVVRVPEHTDVFVTSTSALRAKPWDGASGGIVAILATGTVTIEGQLDADGRGFRGGLVHLNGTFWGCTGLDGFPRDGYSSKGEGLVPSGYTGIVDAGDARGGRGVIANGGGGGNCHNGGGGGGGNGGAGGKGGRSYDGLDVGGYGGSSVITGSTERLLLGGGGGAGDAENNTIELESDGAPGGGAIFVRAATFFAPGRVTASGAKAVDGDKNGGAGGGAGGTIAVRATTRISCASMNAAGGGGSSVPGAFTGPGGGGGGGHVFLTAPTIECTPNVAPGDAGTGEPDDAGWGPTRSATNGETGKVVTAQ